MTTPTVVLEVSWNGDDDFSDANEDITAYTLAVSCQRGRDSGSQLIARSTAGQLQAILYNPSGRFSRFNSSSPLYGSLLPGRKVRFRTTAPTAATLWTGFLDDIQPVTGGDIPTVRLIAYGAFRRLADGENKINAGPLVGAQTGTVIGSILDAAAWPVGARSIQTGEVPLGNWYVVEKGAVEALQEVEDAEQGFVYEGLDFDIVFEGRYHRLLNEGTSQGTFTDAVTGNWYLPPNQRDPLREVFNVARANVTPWSTGALAVLWTLQDVPVLLGAGQSISYTAQVSSGYVDPWTTPVVGTDIVQTGVANGDVGVSVTKTATKMLITVTNNHATASASISLFQARGVPITALDSYQLIAEDATSKTAYGQRSYPLPTPWYPNGAYAQAGLDYFISLKKDPHPQIELAIPANVDNTLFAHAVQRALSDRITVVATGILTNLGINQDFFIEAIAHEYSAATATLVTTWDLSPADVAASYWILGVDQLDVGTRLAY